MNLIEYQFCSVGRQYRKARGKHTISKMYKLTFFFIYYWSFSNNTPPCKSNELSWDLFPESNNVSESNNIGICHQQSLLTVPSCILWCGIILGCQQRLKSTIGTLVCSKQFDRQNAKYVVFSKITEKETIATFELLLQNKLWIV